MSGQDRRTVVTLTDLGQGDACATGECPTIYRTDRGTLVLQGYVFEPEAAGTTIPAGEQMIEIPAELLAE